MMVSAIISTVLSIALGLLPWFLPECGFPYKIVCTLVILICYSIFWIVCLLIQNKRLEESKKDIAQKHRALTARFNEKRIELNANKTGLQQIGYCIEIAMQSEKDDRLQILHSCFADVMLNLRDKGKG